ncbi:MAG: Hint domain-containing protein [Pseudomonadota bacterium]|nr:Hint domain-containing protein [Pseudomonadota bacterium]
MAGFVFISEIHYDNASTDVGEFVELTGEAGTDLTGWSLALYNGNNGEVYNTIDLSSYGVITEERDGFGTVVIDFPSNGLQNGSPDGIALVNADGTAVEFISYEGTLTAVGGPADGLESEDIGASQSGTTLVNSSIEFNGSTGNWDNNNGTNTKGSVGESIPCFLAGTLITVEKGYARVENLKIGDRVLTQSGAIKPIKWIGFRHVSATFLGRHNTPVCIEANSFGVGLPSKNLYVSPDHAMLIDGVLIQASALVNQQNIAFTPLDHDFCYYHIELEEHDIIFANNSATETYVDVATRKKFDNFAEFEALYHDALGFVQPLTLPRIKSKRQLPVSIQQRVSKTASIQRA